MHKKFILVCQSGTWAEASEAKRTAGFFVITGVGHSLRFLSQGTINRMTKTFSGSLICHPADAASYMPDLCGSGGTRYCGNSVACAVDAAYNGTTISYNGAGRYIVFVTEMPYSLALAQ